MGSCVSESLDLFPQGCPGPMAPQYSVVPFGEPCVCVSLSLIAYEVLVYPRRFVVKLKLDGSA